MNRKKWQAKGIPRQTLALKLVEEAAEVGNVLTDTMIVEDGEYAGERKLTSAEKAAILEELSHVEFIARCLRNKIR